MGNDMNTGYKELYNPSTFKFDETFNMFIYKQRQFQYSDKKLNKMFDKYYTLFKTMNFDDDAKRYMYTATFVLALITDLRGRKFVANNNELNQYYHSLSDKIDYLITSRLELDKI